MAAGHGGRREGLEYQQNSCGIHNQKSHYIESLSGRADLFTVTKGNSLAGPVGLLAQNIELGATHSGNTDHLFGPPLRLPVSDR